MAIGGYGVEASKPGACAPLLATVAQLWPTPAIVAPAFGTPPDAVMRRCATLDARPGAGTGTMPPGAAAPKIPFVEAEAVLFPGPLAARANGPFLPDYLFDADYRREMARRASLGGPGLVRFPPGWMFRKADYAVIGRSAISAAVTLLVGIVWTLSMDMLKVGAEWLLGEENETVATIAGAIIAAGIFAPTQALAMRWAKVRLEGDESRITKLIGRLAVWRATEAPEEIAVRTLSALHAAVHCSAAAVLVDGPRGLTLLASRDIERADALSEPGFEPAKDSRFAMRLPLEDEDGPLGLLLLGPRSDLNRYNAAQLRGLGDLTEPFAEALRAALKREHHAATMHLKLGSVEERLARLEQSGPKLSPT